MLFLNNIENNILREYVKKIFLIISWNQIAIKQFLE